VSILLGCTVGVWSGLKGDTGRYLFSFLARNFQHYSGFFAPWQANLGGNWGIWAQIWLLGLGRILGWRGGENQVPNKDKTLALLGGWLEEIRPFTGIRAGQRDNCPTPHFHIISLILTLGKAFFAALWADKK
jgi:hypothetical protein